MSSFHTPIRYPGGKARLGPWIACLLRCNRISGGVYAEPYAGGAGAAIYLLKNEYVERLLLNDLDLNVFAFWRSVLDNTTEFCEKIHSTVLTIDEWDRQKNILADSKSTIFERGFAFFLLNRTNRSGILSGGVIGGRRQEGALKMDARYNRQSLSDRVKAIGLLKDRISVMNKDACEFIVDDCSNLPSRSLVYLDPPYFDKGEELYANYYQRQDHSQVAALVKSLKTPWLVTYDNVGQIQSLYAKKNRCTFAMTYSTTSERKKAYEQMFWGNCELPLPPKLSRTPSAYPKTWIPENLGSFRKPCSKV